VKNIISLTLFLCLSVSSANAMMLSQPNNNDNNQPIVKQQKQIYPRGYYKSRPAKAIEKQKTVNLKKARATKQHFLDQ